MNECCRDALLEAADECDRRWAELRDMPDADLHSDGVMDGWDYAEQMLRARASTQTPAAPAESAEKSLAEHARDAFEALANHQRDGPAEVSMVCPSCEWQITDDVPDRRCTLCGTSMVYDDGPGQPGKNRDDGAGLAGRTISRSPLSPNERSAGEGSSS